MQKDALDRLGQHQMLCEPEMLEAVEPDVHLVATLLSLNRVMRNKTRTTARKVVAKVVEDLECKLAAPMRQAVASILNRATRKLRPRHNEIDWLRTIRANLRHYQPEIPHHHPRNTYRLRPARALAARHRAVRGRERLDGGLGRVRGRVVMFDTAVADLTLLLSDPVDVLFDTQLGGGTDINRALAYCQGLVTRPRDTIFVLISDHYVGGNNAEMLGRAAALVASGVQVIAPLALNDAGAPSYDRNNAAKLATLGVPSFACAPDLFPDLMAAAIGRHSLEQWTSQAGIVRA